MHTSYYVSSFLSYCNTYLIDQITNQIYFTIGFLDSLKELLSDSNPMVVANAVAALSEINEASPTGKCFTYVTKTRANLTYSRNPENYNGTINFEIDIMKNSPPLKLNLCQTWL